MSTDSNKKVTTRESAGEIVLENKELPHLPKHRRLLSYGSHDPTLINARATGFSAKPQGLVSARLGQWLEARRASLHRVESRYHGPAGTSRI